MNYIIFDLEATCWERPIRHRQEIIEIGAIKINEAYQITEEFQIFVKPSRHPILSEFCKELTSIRQEDVDAAPPFPMALDLFKEWIDTQNSPYLLCS